MKKKNGFTLTELIVVIVIIGILATVLIPSLTGYIEKAKFAAAEKEATTYVTAFGTWQVEVDLPNESDAKLSSFQSYLDELGLDSDVVSNVSEDGFTYTASNNEVIIYNVESGFSK